MKHPDESAQTSALQLAKRRRYASDTDDLIRDYERVVKEAKRQARKAGDLDKDLRAMRRARDGFKDRLNRAESENTQLKTTLRRLRQSRSLRLGRSLTAPYAIAKRAARKLKAAASSFRPSSFFPTAKPAAAAKNPAAAPSKPAVSKPAVSKPAPRQEVPAYEQLLAEFQSAPSKGSLLKLVMHEYFVRGDLALPASRISAHRTLLTGLTAKDKEILDNIEGQNALLESGIFVSPKQPNPGYLVERGRVLYCAHSTGHFNSNGYSTRTAGLVTGLVDNGEDIVVAARPGYPWDARTDVPAPGQRRFERKIAGVPHVFNPGPDLSKDRLDHYLMNAADVIVREAQRNRVAVIHAASNYVTALPALMAARRLGLPFVYEVRGIWEITELSNRPWWNESDRYRLAVKLEALVVQEADRVLAITRQVREELIRRGADEAKIELLPNSVDTDTFKPMPPKADLRARLGLPEDSIVIGYTGSLVAYEGLPDLLEATRILVDQGLDVRCVIVGDGTQLGELKKTAGELGLGKHVIFTGRVPAKSVKDYVSLFDIMPCPRRRFPVTEMVSPLKPLEAMASGKAVVLSDLGPLRDLAGQAQDRALLCSPGDPASLAAVLRRLAEDAQLRSEMGRRARLWTIGHRTWAQASETAAATHAEARSSYGAHDAGKPLQAHRIGIIADQFTTEGLLPEAGFVVLEPATWRSQLAANPIDALFVESAWEGVGGLWRQKVGFYGDEPFAVLRDLLRYCNANAVPTVFWNKEDPVHFNRFRVTAKYFDHVFTTDAECIPKYLESAGRRLKTVASLPFYAQPRLHNPLPAERPYEHSVAYAGSYYGEKYPKRSTELARLLGAARNFGLAIYDRQHLNPDSPYRFPAELAGYVRGGLAYGDMVDAYKAHPVHINVNSVDASPTMFSRRVMEVAASGGAVVSGTGRGVREVLNGLVPVVSSKDEAELIIEEWMGNEAVRLRDAWLAYRYVHRGHTAGHRLAFALRTAGLVVRAPELPSYAVFLPEATAEQRARVDAQTVQPRTVYAPSGSAGVSAAVDIEDARRKAAEQGIGFLGTLPGDTADRTAFEDLLTATTFGDWNRIGYGESGLETKGLGLVQPGAGNPQLPALTATGNAGGDGSGDAALTVRRTLLRSERPAVVDDPAPRKQTVLVAGHDLKFAGGIVEELKHRGHTVVFDQWRDHNKHDPQQSEALLKSADVVFCEWGLGNALWYSKNKLPHQRLVLRVHSQEIFRPYLKDVAFSAVDSVVFVGRHIADIAVRDHNVPSKKALIVPNPVNPAGEEQAKDDDHRFHLGLVGIVPAQKHLDRALDVLKALRAKDNRYRLFVKGKRPEEFAWMAKRPEEMRFYEEQYARIAEDPDLAGGVTFDPHGNDMAEWYAKIGVVLSVSDFESFHLTLADGAMNGAVPASLAWPGADQIYPTSWLAASVDEMVQHIEDKTASPEDWRANAAEAQAFVQQRFSKDEVLAALCARILGAPVRTDGGQ
ncbi:glycosyltransferase [Arthrobacter silvisoli]|uniref:glycosyltransferase n=1 Tax=Arthrobacter silvisoli TaxID=2291022 RepID=UPI000E20CC31|nr:glycosyltransferase [Arthrobacter silvisoli]